MGGLSTGKPARLFEKSHSAQQKALCQMKQRNDNGRDSNEQKGQSTQSGAGAIQRGWLLIAGALPTFHHLKNRFGTRQHNRSRNDKDTSQQSIHPPSGHFERGRNPSHHIPIDRLIRAHGSAENSFFVRSDQLFEDGLTDQY